MGLVSAWACMIGHNLLLFILFGLYYAGGRWNPITHPPKERIPGSPENVV